jgi:amino acid adenylation domain-containing protein
MTDGRIGLITDPASRPAHPGGVRPATGPVDAGREQRRPVHELVAGHAATHSERVAVTGPSGELTYGQLDRTANRLATLLIRSGVRPDEPVGVYLERSTDFVVTILAVLKAGGNYVPLDPDYPAARLALMIERTAPRVIVTRAASADRLPAAVPDVLLWEQLAGQLDGLPAEAPPVRVHPDHLAYTMFTSGSTGVPKGVAVPHAGIVRLVCDPGYVTLDEDEVVLHNSSTSFDAATFEIWGALANGARLVIGPPGPVTIGELGELLRTRGVTTAFFTTGLFHLLVDECLADLTGMRQIVAGGDVMSPDRAHRLVTALPQVRLVNGYGPTEVTTFTTCHVVTPDQPAAYAVPIGRPIRRTRVRILDADLNEVPPGVTGHLLAGGDGLARGYLTDPELTAQRFIPDPYLPGQRLYVTGDLARYRDDGVIEFQGRADQQIKKRGFRVEPAEIEESLRRDPDLRDAAVLARGANAEDKQLVAYLVPLSPGGDADLVGRVRAALRTRLPEYLIPDLWLTVDTLPLNANGKVDRAALAALGAAEHHVADEHQPVGGTEARLAGVWRELFEVESVGRHDDFFELGGHSLIASRMAVRLRTLFDLEVPLAVIFDHPTIAQLAELIDQVD